MREGVCGCNVNLIRRPRAAHRALLSRVRRCLAVWFAVHHATAVPHHRRVHGDHALFNEISHFRRVLLKGCNGRRVG